jgi:hypothetical protein
MAEPTAKDSSLDTQSSVSTNNTAPPPYSQPKKSLEPVYIHGRLYKAHEEKDYNGCKLTEDDCKKIVADFYDARTKSASEKQPSNPLYANYEHKGNSRLKLGIIEDLYYNPKQKRMNAVVAAFPHQAGYKKIEPRLKHYDTKVKESPNGFDGVPWTDRLGYSLEIDYEYDDGNNNSGTVDINKLRVSGKKLTGMGLVRNPDMAKDETFVTSWSPVGLQTLAQKDKEFLDYLMDTTTNPYMKEKYLPKDIHFQSKGAVPIQETKPVNKEIGIFFIYVQLYNPVY